MEVECLPVSKLIFCVYLRNLLYSWEKLFKKRCSGPNSLFLNTYKSETIKTETFSLREVATLISCEYSMWIETVRLARAARCDFFRNFLQTIPQRMTTFFAPCTLCDFLRSFLLIIWSREKIRLIKVHFLGWIPFLSAKCRRSSIWSWLLYSQYLRTSLRFYMDKLSILHKNVRRKNRSGAHGRSPICFNAIYSSAESSADTCGKRSQHVALALCIVYLWSELSKIRFVWPRVTAVRITCVLATSWVYLATNDSDCLHEQQYTIKFCVQLGKNQIVVAYEMFLYRFFLVVRSIW